MIKPNYLQSGASAMNEQTLLMVYDPSLLSKQSTNPDTTILVSCTDRAQKFLSDKGLKFTKKDDLPINKDQARYVEWMKTTYLKQIEDGKDWRHFFDYKGISLWRMVDYWFFDSTFYLPQISRVLETIDEINYLWRYHNFTRLIVLTNDSSLSELYGKFCTQKEIEYVQVSSVAGRFLNKIRRFKELWLLPRKKMVLVWLRAILRNIVWFCVKGPAPQFKSDKNVTLFFPEILERFSSSGIPREQYVGSLIEPLKKVSNLRMIGFLRGYTLGIANMKIRKQLHGDKYAPFESHSQLSLLIRAIAGWDKIELKSLLERKKALSQLFVYEGLDISPQITPNLQFLKYLVIDAIRTYEQAKKHINAYKPKVIVIGEDPTHESRSTIAAAWQSSIPTITISEGMLHNTTAFCNLDLADIGPNGSCQSPYCPIPTKVVAYGEVYKKSYTEYMKVPDPVVFCYGSPRYDFLFSSDLEFNRKEILEKIGLDPSKKTVIYTTQPLPDKEEKAKIANTVLLAVSKIPEIQLLLKIHPTEVEGDFYKSIAASLSMKNIAFVKGNMILSTYAAIFASDLLITASSGTSAEGILMKRPVIIMDPRKKNYASLIGGERRPLIWVAHDETDLGKFIPIILGNDTSKEDWDRHFSYLYAGFDGKSTDRVIDMVSSLLSSKDSSR